MRRFRVSSAGVISYATLKVRAEAGVARVTIDHPPLNVLDKAMFEDLTALCDALERAGDVRVVIVDSAVPDFFIAHADLRHRPFPAVERPIEPNPYQALFARYRELPMATIALLEGIARGGGAEFALALDMRFAVRGRAVLGQPEVLLGLCPGFGGTQAVTRLAGRSRALELLMSGDDYDADLAERYNLVNRALDQAEAPAFVNELARRIASFPPGGVLAAKRATLAAEAPLTPGLIAEHALSAGTLSDPEAHRRLRRALALGAQTRAFELDFPKRFDDLAH